MSRIANHSKSNSKNKSTAGSALRTGKTSHKNTYGYRPIGEKTGEDVKAPRGGSSIKK